MGNEDKKSRVIPITDLKKNEEGIIAELNTTNDSILRKLMAMGVLPGMTLKMIQRFPSYVFQVGYTQVAVDKEIAGVILVNKGDISRQPI